MKRNLSIMFEGWTLKFIRNLFLTRCLCKISSHECLHLALAMDSKTRTQRSSTVAVADGENRWALFKTKYRYNLGGIRDQRCQLSNLSRWLFSNMLSFWTPYFHQPAKKRLDVDVGQRMVFMGSLLLVDGFKFQICLLTFTICGDDPIRLGGDKPPSTRGLVVENPRCVSLIFQKRAPQWEMVKLC